MTEILLLFIIKATFVMLAALLILQLQGDAPASQRHRHLAAALLSLICLPFLDALPEISLQVLPTNSSWDFSILPNKPSSLVLEIYCLGLLGALSVTASKHWQLYRLVSQASPINDARINTLINRHGQGHVQALCSQHIKSPITCGFINARIVLPCNFLNNDNKTIEAGICHELAHIRRYDWLLQLCMDCLLAFNWFNPLAYLCINNLKNQAEFSSDDDVLLYGGDNREYAQALISYARQLPLQQSRHLAPAWLDANLKQRIQALLALRKRERSDTTRLIETTVAYIFCLLPFTVVHAIPAPSAYADFAKPQPITLIDKPRTNNTSSFTSFCGLMVYRPESINKILTSPHPSKGLTVPITRGSKIAAEIINTISAPTFTPQAQVQIALKPQVSISGFMPRKSIIPKYPKKALRKGIEGYAIVRFDILPNGNVINATVSTAKPSHIFDATVLNAINNSQYAPKLINNVAVTVHSVQTRYVFKLRDHSSPYIQPITKFYGPTLIAQGE